MDNSVIRKLLEPVVEDMGYELVMVELTGSPSGGQVLRAFIDAPGGILLADCEQVSRQISAILDVEDPIKGNTPWKCPRLGLTDRWFGLSTSTGFRAVR